LSLRSEEPPRFALQNRQMLIVCELYCIHVDWGLRGLAYFYGCSDWWQRHQHAETHVIRDSHVFLQQSHFFVGIWSGLCPNHQFLWWFRCACWCSNWCHGHQHIENIVIRCGFHMLPTKASLFVKYLERPVPQAYVFTMVVLRRYVHALCDGVCDRDILRSGQYAIGHSRTRSELLSRSDSFCDRAVKRKPPLTECARSGLTSMERDRLRSWSHDRGRRSPCNRWASKYVCIHECMLVWTHVCMNACMYTWVCMQMYAYVCMHVYMCASTYVRL